MYSTKKFLIVCICLISIPACLSKSENQDSDVLHRAKRQLLFPNSTLLQLNAGVGTPTPIKTINVNWAFQANFQLPWNRTQIPLDVLEADSGYPGLSRGKREVSNNAITSSDERIYYENDARLYHFYKYVEDVLNGFGHNGTACVLRALCHLGAEPLHNDDDEDLLHELASYVLNPENDNFGGETTNAETFPYIKAFKSGESLEYCMEMYNCSISLVEMFTKINDIS
ncbi:unnamed protein product [Parnassius mnemosyne]|uniref:Uncharacterized protein n=1 Tax=Parnassius mnemosyne TaxID=213953 RepID=A0AAV1KE62_9NEOP